MVGVERDKAICVRVKKSNMRLEMSWQVQVQVLGVPLPSQNVVHQRTSSVPRCDASRISISIEQVPPNARRLKMDKNWHGGFSLGLDLGQSRTGLALSKGFSVRPLSVLELRGEKLDKRVMEIAEREEADEFIIGLPKSGDGNETPQSNKVRSVAGRLAVRAAQRGWRVYLMDEHGTSQNALHRMIDMGLKKSARQTQIDAYSAVMILERYFSMSGDGTELVLPKCLELQEKILRGPPEDSDFFDPEFDE